MLKEAVNILSPEEIAQVRERSDFWGVWGVVSCWGMILGAMALFAWYPNPLTFIIAFVIIGARQLGLAVLMHDAAHGIMCKTHGLNEFLGTWFCGNPIGVAMAGYRHYHLKHHRFTQQLEDPDLGLSAAFPITKTSLRRKIIRDMTGQTFWKQRKAQFRNALGQKDWPLSKRAGWFVSRLGGFYLTNGILLAALIASGHWYLYFVLWLLPLATYNMMITRIRNIAEHAMVPDNNDPFRNARTTKTNIITRLLLAPYAVNYHVEHHLFMWVPWYNLAKLHRMLLAKGYADRMEYRQSYREVLGLATSKPEAAAAA